MKSILTGLLYLLPFTVSAQTDSATISQLNHAWIASYATRDTEQMRQILANDFVMISPKGTKLYRKDIISNVGDPNVAASASIDEEKIRIFGNTALVVSFTHFSIGENGHLTEGTNCYSDLYIKRAGIWKAVAAQVTVLTATNN